MIRSSALVITVSAFALACSLAAASPPPSAASLAELNAIIETYQRDHSAWVRQVSGEQDPQRRTALIAARPDKEAAVRQVMALAEAAGRSETGFMGWAWAYAESEKDESRSRALSPLLEHWSASSEMMIVLPALERDDHPRAKDALVRLTRADDAGQVSLAASVALASWLVRCEPEAGEDQAVELLERVVEARSDVPHPEGGTLAETASSRLFAIRHLRVGATVPEIAGEDLEGRALALSSYRGRVVLLTFWAHWCQGCMVQAVAERDLVDRFRDRPFVMLGVNCDPGPPASILAQNRERDVSWRSFRNDAQGRTFGSVARAWNVRTLPTTYLIGHDGIILDKWEATVVAHADLSSAVERAVTRAERARDGAAQRP